ncbi:MAG: nucleotidyltransferase family protein [Bacillota bacterium]
MRYDAVLLAGGRSSKLSSTQNLTHDYEALVRVAGEPLINYVLQALTQAERIRDIIVIGPQEVEEYLLDQGADVVIATKQSLLENVELGLEYLSTHSQSKWGVFITADLPLINSQSIDDFIIKAEALLGYQVYYPIIEQDINLATYPQVDSTYVTLKDGTYTGGNLTLIETTAITDDYSLLEQIFARRKSPLQLAKILGVKFALRLLCQRVTLAEIESKLTALVGSKCKAVLTNNPELGFDVDTRADLELAGAIIKS